MRTLSLRILHKFVRSALSALQVVAASTSAAPKSRATRQLEKLTLPHRRVLCTVAVQAAKQTPGLDHFPLRHHHAMCRFSIHQLCVVDFTGGIHP